MDQLEKQLADLFGKLPNLPGNARELIVKVAPWASLILGLLLLPLVLAAFGLGALLTPFGFFGGARRGVLYFVILALSALSMIFWYAAIPGLFKRSRGGWQKSFYATIVGALSDLIALDIWGLIVGTGISLYFLFQIRSYYNGKSATPAAKV